MTGMYGCGCGINKKHLKSDSEGFWFECKCGFQGFKMPKPINASFGWNEKMRIVHEAKALLTAR